MLNDYFSDLLPFNSTCEDIKKRIGAKSYYCLLITMTDYLLTKVANNKLSDGIGI
jgi:hypothetical protein